MPTEEPSNSETSEADLAVSKPDHVAVEPRNLIVLAIQNIVLRVGWIFKTESVIMPAFLDVIAGQGFFRGMLPVLNRLGQSLLPLLYTGRLRAAPIKKYAVSFTAITMAIPFFILAAVWANIEHQRNFGFVILFLTMYFIFFSATGLNQLAFGTIQGKLIRPDRRGRLMGIAGILGSAAAVTAALMWLKTWINQPNYDGYVSIFIFNGSAFFIAGVVTLFCSEYPEAANTPVNKHWTTPFSDAWVIYKTDKVFRRAARVAMLFICSILIFPHYQMVGREMIGTNNNDLIYWVIVQNISVGLYSPLFGFIADRFGNRLAIRISTFAAATPPIVALLFASGIIPNAKELYWITFVLLGLTPIVMKTILNYTLELVEPEHHPQYLSTMRLCFAVPFVFSPLVGLMVDQLPLEVPFLMVSALIALGGLLTFSMEEPREKMPEEPLS